MVTFQGAVDRIAQLPPVEPAFWASPVNRRFKEVCEYRTADYDPLIPIVGLADKKKGKDIRPSPEFRDDEIVPYFECMSSVANGGVPIGTLCRFSHPIPTYWKEEQFGKVKTFAIGLFVKLDGARAGEGWRLFGWIPHERLHPERYLRNRDTDDTWNPQRHYYDLCGKYARIAKYLHPHPSASPVYDPQYPLDNDVLASGKKERRYNHLKAQRCLVEVIDDEELDVLGLNVNDPIVVGPTNRQIIFDEAQFTGVAAGVVG